MPEWLICLIVFGSIGVLILIIGLIFFLIEKISNYLNQKIVNKLKNKYPQLMEDIKNFLFVHNLQQRDFCDNIYPIRKQIDDLVANNYIQPSIKEKQLYELRDKLQHLQEANDMVRAKNDKMYQDIDDKVKEIYKTDKKIIKLWWIEINE